MLWLLLALTLTLALAYRRSNARTVLAAYAGLLLAYGVFGDSPLQFGLALLLFGGVSVLLTVAALREEWITRPVLDAIQGRLLPARPGLRGLDDPPAAHSPEQQLFGDAGLPAVAAPAATDDAAGDWASAVQSLADPLAAAADALTPDALTALRRSGLFGLELPAEFEGLSLHPGERNLVLQALAALEGGAPAVVLLAVSGAATSAVHARASDAQRRARLPRYAQGERLVALAPAQARSGAPSLDRARVRRGLWHGRETLGLELRFERRGVPMADDFVLRLPLQGATGLLADASGEAPTEATVLVPRDLDGLGITGCGPADGLLTRVHLRAENAFIALDRLLPTPVTERPCTGTVTLCRSYAAIAAGEVLRALRRAQIQHQRLAYERAPAAAARDRALSEGTLDRYGLDLLQDLLASPALPLSPAAAALAAAFAGQLHASALRELSTLDTAVDGRAGRQLAAMLPRPDLERLLLAAFPEQQRLFAAAGSQPYGRALMRFDAALWPLLGSVWQHQARGLLHALSDGRIARSRDRQPRRIAQRYARYRLAIACAADAWLLARDRGPADGAAEASLLQALMALLGLAAALHAAALRPPSRDEWPLLEAWSARSYRRIEAALDDFIFQQPTRRRGAALRLLLLPLGRLAPMHTDLEAARIVGWLARPGAIRERLLGALPPAAARSRDHDLGRLEIALAAAGEARRKLDAAIDSGRIEPGFPLDQIGQAAQLGLLDADDAERLRRACNLLEDTPV